MSHLNIPTTKKKRLQGPPRKQIHTVAMVKYGHDTGIKILLNQESENFNN